MASILQELLVFTSPPASGKTTWIGELKKVYFPEQLLVISPLRALRDECVRRWENEVLVMTPEEWIRRPVVSEVVIFDEFHLHAYWGDTFRPLMWEVFFGVAADARVCILLTATFGEDIKSTVETFSCQFDRILWADHGNQTLRLKPKTYLKAPSRRWIEELILCDRSAGTKLIFCRYRQQVFAVKKKLEQQGFRCISCVGGEARFMAPKLELLPEPDFIIATTVLSHGVNLPEIRKVYFLYALENLDFWIQMVARGGRKGSDFHVIGLEKPFVGEFYPVKNFFKVMFYSLRLWGLNIVDGQRNRIV
jgi:superfamily II DNA helicase RecQ